MYFVDKIFLGALISIPLLVLIYFLHRKLKSVQISSLILWENQTKSLKSGTGLKAMPLPFKFFLEALMLLLLAIAAAGPFISSHEKVPALTVILDDSFSMTAGKGVTPRKKAEDALLNYLSSFPSRPVQLILAGASPRILGEADSGSGKITHLLKNWGCRQATSDLDAALLFARKTFGSKNDILLLTDRKASYKQPPPGMNWFAFGAPIANAAIINAARTASQKGDKCLVEVVNYSTKTKVIPLKVSFEGKETTPLLFNLKIPANKKVKKSFRLPKNCGTVKLTLPEDQLEFDNSISLIPVQSRKLRIRLGKLPPKTSELLKKALASNSNISFSGIKPHLFFTAVQQKIKPEDIDWQVIISDSKDAKAYIGPFTVDRQHPLGNGLQLAGTIWGAGPGKMPGKSIILAGNTPLVSDYLYRDFRHLVFIKFSPQMSTFQESPNWPVLFYNLCEWRRQALPGLSKSNYRAGEKIYFNAPSNIPKVKINGPDKKNFELALHERSCVLDLMFPGKYEIEAGEKKYDFMINPLSADESDLRDCATMKLEGEKNENIFRKRFMNVAWIFLLAILALSLWHLYLIRRSKA